MAMEQSCILTVVVVSQMHTRDKKIQADTHTVRSPVSWLDTVLY